MPVTQNDDEVWFDSGNKLQEICNAVHAGSGNGNNVLVLAHFPLTLSALRRLLGERGIGPVEFSSYDASRLCSSPPATVWLGLARAFQSPVAIQLHSPSVKHLTILVAEHHPRLSRDQELIDSADKLPCDSQLGFHFSLDDPLLEHFGGAASIRKLFRQLGIKETESISHPLVTSAIRTAQEKIERQVPRDVQTESIEDWFKYNLPGKR